MAVLRGSDAKLRDEYVVYSAHADHLGIGPAVNGDSVYNGALDNASGIASVIEIARAFTRLELRQKRSIVFLAVTAEERGLLGSDYFAQLPTFPRSQIVANINVDGIDLFFDSRDVIAFGSEHSSLARAVETAAAKMGMGVSPDPMPEQLMLSRSDQYSFMLRGIPAVLVAFGFRTVDPGINGMQVFLDLQRTRYHQPSDDLSQPMNFEVGAKNTRFNFLLGYVAAQDDARPRWNDGDFFGKTFGNNQ